MFRFARSEGQLWGKHKSFQAENEFVISKFLIRKYLFQTTFLTKIHNI